jgi:YHS domain-containing protein
MNIDTLKSLLWWLVVGVFFFWMMRRGGCGMMAHGRSHSGAPDDGYGEPPRSSSDKPVDPVCGMAIDPKQAVGTRLVSGHTFFFCSTVCLDAFDKNQAAYAHGPHAEASHHHQHMGC